MHRHPVSAGCINDGLARRTARGEQPIMSAPAVLYDPQVETIRLWRRFNVWNSLATLQPQQRVFPMRSARFARRPDWALCGNIGRVLDVVLLRSKGHRISDILLEQMRHLAQRLPGSAAVGMTRQVVIPGFLQRLRPILHTHRAPLQTFGGTSRSPANVSESIGA